MNISIRHSTSVYDAIVIKNCDDHEWNECHIWNEGISILQKFSSSKLFFVMTLDQK